MFNMVLIIQLLAIAGFLLSFYALYVEKKTEQDKNYQPLCDISNKISCTKTFKSKWGKTFGIPNSVYGLLFYVLLFILTFISIKLIFYLVVLSVLGSFYLAYVLYFKLKTVCLVCYSTYIVNILLLIFSYLKG